MDEPQDKQFRTQVKKDKKLCKIGFSLKDIFDSSTENPFFENEDLNYSENSIVSIDSPINSFVSPLKSIKITRFALESMFQLAKAVKNYTHSSVEVFAFCLGSEETITDIFIPVQKVGGASVHVPEVSMKQYYNFIRNNPLEVLGWTHSHADFNVFFSGTDYQNQSIILDQTANYTYLDKIRVKYCYGITVNLKRDLFGIITTHFPSGEIINQKAVFELFGETPTERSIDQIYFKILSDLLEKIHFPAHLNKIDLSY